MEADKIVKPESEYNFIYERLKQIFEHSAYLPLENYNSQHVKRCDLNKRLSNENICKIAAIINFYKHQYVKQVESEIDVFMDKYGLKERLRNRSEVCIYDKLLSDFEISLSQFQEMEESTSLETEELMIFYLTKYLEEKNQELEDHNTSMKLELETLRAANKLNLD